MAEATMRRHVSKSYRHARLKASIHTMAVETALLVGTPRNAAWERKASQMRHLARAKWHRLAHRRRVRP
jgi:hypothetical protein